MAAFQLGSRGKYSACGETWHFLPTQLDILYYSTEQEMWRKQIQVQTVRKLIGTNETEVNLLHSALLWPTYLCLIFNSLYSSRRITTPARVSSSMATLISKLQHDFPADPGELHVLGGSGVWRGTSIPCLGLIMAWTRTGWTVTLKIPCGFSNTGWGGIWREVRQVVWRPYCIAARFDSAEEAIISPFRIHREMWAVVTEEAASKCQMLCNNNNNKISINAGMHIHARFKSNPCIVLLYNCCTHLKTT